MTELTYVFRSLKKVGLMSEKKLSSKLHIFTNNLKKKIWIQL